CPQEPQRPRRRAGRDGQFGRDAAARRIRFHDGLVCCSYSGSTGNPHASTGILRLEPGVALGFWRHELDRKDHEWNAREMQLPLKTERRLIMQPLGEPAVRRQDEFVREANAIREPLPDLLDQALERFDGIDAISDEARRAESVP